MFDSYTQDQKDCGRLCRSDGETYLIVHKMYSIKNPNEDEKRTKPLKTLYLAVKIDQEFPSQPWVITDPEFLTEEEVAQLAEK